MTLKELFDEFGSVWLARDIDPKCKYFRPLGYSEGSPSIIGEVYNGSPYNFSYENKWFVLYEPEKKKVVRWKWAFTDGCGIWFEHDYFATENEINNVSSIPFGRKHVKLEYTRMEFDE